MAAGIHTDIHTYRHTYIHCSNNRCSSNTSSNSTSSSNMLCTTRYYNNSVFENSTGLDLQVCRQAPKKITTPISIVGAPWRVSFKIGLKSWFPLPLSIVHLDYAWRKTCNLFRTPKPRQPFIDREPWGSTLRFSQFLTAVIRGHCFLELPEVGYGLWAP